MGEFQWSIPLSESGGISTLDRYVSMGSRCIGIAPDLGILTGGDSRSNEV